MRHLATLFAALFASTFAACSSEPLANGTGSGGGSSSGGASGAAASSGRAPVSDYTGRGCYGETTTTEVYDFESHTPVTVTATCRAEGERSRVYVADELWEESAAGSTRVTQEDVNAFMLGYEQQGRAGSFLPDLGVLPTDELVFGELDPNAFPDGKLPVFVVTSGVPGEGYLCGWCAELALHLNAGALGSLQTEQALSIAAHESFHAIHRGYDADESAWVDETLAQAAMTVNGFFTDRAWVESFLNDPNTAWGPGLDDALAFDYGAGLLFGTYLWEVGGADLLRAITHEPLDDWEGIDAALASSGQSQSGWDLYLDMALAVGLNDPELGYGFTSFELGDVASSPVPLAGARGRIEPYGLVYLELPAEARGVRVESSEELGARLVVSGTPPRIVDLPIDGDVDFEAPSLLLVLSARTQADYSLVVR